MLTLVWSVLMVVFGLLAADRPVWLHAMSLLVFLQWLTDSLDGTLGKYRKQGLVKWGFFADHLLDLLFAGSIVIAYSFMVEAWLLRLCFMVLLYGGVQLGRSGNSGSQHRGPSGSRGATSSQLWRIDWEANVDNAPRRGDDRGS